MSRRSVAAALTAAVLGPAVLAGCTSEGTVPPPDEPPISLGWSRLEEPIEVDLPTGDPVDAAGAEQSVDPGEPVLVNFWASWCAPCRQEMPLLVDLADRDDVQVVGVSLDRFEEKAVEFLDEYDADYPSWRDPDMEYLATYAPAVGVQLPSTVLVVDGQAVAAHPGEFTSAEDLSPQRVAELAR